MLQSSNPRIQGNAGIGAAISYFTSQGLIVSIPLTDAQEYDLIVDIDGGLKKIQVKTSTHVVKSGSYEVGLRTHGGNKSCNTIKFFDPRNVDYLFVLLGNGERYLIPSTDDMPRNSITLGDKYQQFRIQ